MQLPSPWHPPLQSKSPAPKQEDVGDSTEEVPSVEAIDYSRIAEEGDGTYSQADELAGSDHELGESTE